VVQQYVYEIFTRSQVGVRFRLDFTGSARRNGSQLRWVLKQFFLLEQKF
jgi:hypothetical protein